jgi:sigma-E factor negative regulatory protein RseA
MAKDSMSQTDQAQLVSALADGELQGDEFVQSLDILRTSEEARARWHGYHLVGEVMRSGAVAAVGSRDEAFVAQLRQRLGEERARAVPPAVAVVRDRDQPGANDEVWRWKLVAGLCSLVAVAVLAWQMVLPEAQDTAPQLAGSSVPSLVTAAPVAAVESQVMLRDPRLDQLIAAHQQQGGTSALQMPAGFLRNATFERPAR